VTGVVLDAVKETIVSRVKQISDGRQVVVTVAEAFADFMLLWKTELKLL